MDLMQSWQISSDAHFRSAVLLGSDPVNMLLWEALEGFAGSLAQSASKPQIGSEAVAGNQGKLLCLGLFV